MLDDPQTLKPFPVPIFTSFVHDHDRFVTGLRPLLLQASRSLASVPRGELHGWQSDSDLLNWGPPTQPLVPLFGEAVLAAAGCADDTDVRLDAWANVFTRDTYFTPHTHAGAAWSGVYYLSAADSDHETGGVLCFGDPRAGSGMVQSPLVDKAHGTVFAMVPQSGQLVVFPSWLMHWVTPYRSDNVRISISFNAV